VLQLLQNRLRTNQLVAGQSSFGCYEVDCISTVTHLQQRFTVGKAANMASKACLVQGVTVFNRRE